MAKQKIKQAEYQENNMEKQDKNNKTKGKNKMQEVILEKVVLSIGAHGDELEKAIRLLEVISKRKIVKTKTHKRIPGFEIRPGLEIGCKVTLRGKDASEMLKKLLAAVNNHLKEKQISDENFSFGIKEYIEIPEMEYQRDIGIMGLNVTVVFKRKGKRVEIKKIKRGKIPRRQRVSKQEIIEYMKNNFQTKILEKQSKKGGEW